MRNLHHVTLIVTSLCEVLINKCRNTFHTTCPEALWLLHCIYTRSIKRLDSTIIFYILSLINIKLPKFTKNYDQFFLTPLLLRG